MLLNLTLLEVNGTLPHAVWHFGGVIYWMVMRFPVEQFLKYQCSRTHMCSGSFVFRISTSSIYCALIYVDTTVKRWQIYGFKCRLPGWQWVISFMWKIIAVENVFFYFYKQCAGGVQYSGCKYSLKAFLWCTKGYLFSVPLMILMHWLVKLWNNVMCYVCACNVFLSYLPKELHCMFYYLDNPKCKATTIAHNNRPNKWTRKTIAFLGGFYENTTTIVIASFTRKLCCYPTSIFAIADGHF